MIKLDEIRARLAEYSKKGNVFQTSEDICFAKYSENVLPALLSALSERDVEIARLREALKGAKVVADQATKIIEADRWISVEARLPEDEQQILVLTRGTKFRVHSGYYAANDGDGYRFRACKDGAWFNGVTHWKPLPAPPDADTGKTISEV